MIKYNVLAYKDKVLGTKVILKNKNEKKKSTFKKNQKYDNKI